MLCRVEIQFRVAHANRVQNNGRSCQKPSHRYLRLYKGYGSTTQHSRLGLSHSFQHTMEQIYRNKERCTNLLNSRLCI